MDVLQRRTSALGARGSHAGGGRRRGAGSVTASTSSTTAPLRGPSSRDSRAPVSRRLQGRVRCHSPEHRRPPRPLARCADPARSARARARGDVAADRIERSARPLPVAGAGLDQAAQRPVCGAAPRPILDGHLIARQAHRAVDVADGTGPASSPTPHGSTVSYLRVETRPAAPASASGRPAAGLPATPYYAEISTSPGSSARGRFLRSRDLSPCAL